MTTTQTVLYLGVIGLVAVPTFAVYLHWMIIPAFRDSRARNRDKILEPSTSDRWGASQMRSARER